jgi:hypothetical protein
MILQRSTPSERHNSVFKSVKTRNALSSYIWSLYSGFYVETSVLSSLHNCANVNSASVMFTALNQNSLRTRMLNAHFKTRILLYTVFSHIWGRGLKPTTHWWNPLNITERILVLPMARILPVLYFNRKKILFVKSGSACNVFSYNTSWKIIFTGPRSGWWKLLILTLKGTRGNVVGWGTKLLIGRSSVRFPMRSLDFSIDLIFPAVLWPWGQLSL